MVESAARNLQDIRQIQVQEWVELHVLQVTVQSTSYHTMGGCQCPL